MRRVNLQPSPLLVGGFVPSDGQGKKRKRRKVRQPAPKLLTRGKVYTRWGFKKTKRLNDFYVEVD